METGIAQASFFDGIAPGREPFARQPIIIDLVDRAPIELTDFAVKHLTPAEEILRVTHEEKANFIIMGTHGRTGLRHLLLGSVAEEVTRHAPCPVFTVRIGLETVA